MFCHVWTTYEEHVIDMELNLIQHKANYQSGVRKLYLQVGMTYISWKSACKTLQQVVVSQLKCAGSSRQIYTKQLGEENEKARVQMTPSCANGRLKALIKTDAISVSGSSSTKKPYILEQIDK